MRKLFILLLVLGVAGTASAVGITVAWDAGGGADNSYTNAANWDNTNHLPTLIDNVSIYKPINGTSATAVTINTQTAVGMTVRVGGGGWADLPSAGPKPATLYIVPGGKLTTAEVFMVGPESTSNRSGILRMTGGNVVTGSVSPTNNHFYVGYGHAAIPSTQYVKGEVYMSGGQMDIAGDFSIAHNAYTIGEVYLSGDAVINVSGNFKMAAGGINASALLDITGGARVVFNGNKLATIEGYIDNGWIKTNGVAWDDYSKVSYDSLTNKTMLIPEPATICLLGIGALSLIRRKK